MSNTATTSTPMLVEDITSNEDPTPIENLQEVENIQEGNHNGLKYPTLQRLARDILAILVTTVASESTFSTSGRLLSPHRSRLHPRTLEALMCAQSWLWSELKSSSPMPEDATIQNILEDYGDHEEEESGAMELTVVESGGKNMEIDVMMIEHGLLQLEEAEIDAIVVLC
uniref:HAT C-terminal dimerisation domain-containing protein n=1 Tax=Fagus sylvatica TaxID=28930 RepID=A0A2N9HD18_FAGSY